MTRAACTKRVAAPPAVDVSPFWFSLRTPGLLRVSTEHHCRLPSSVTGERQRPCNGYASTDLLLTLSTVIWRLYKMGLESSWLLIFGGCCSNVSRRARLIVPHAPAMRLFRPTDHPFRVQVFTLEAIVKYEPDSGMSSNHMSLSSTSAAPVG